jgi:hypothetical protein
MLQINHSYLIVENNLILIPLIILSVSITILLVNYLFIGNAAIVISFLIVVYGERFLIGLIIVSLLTIVSDFDSTLILFVHITNFSLLGFLTYGIIVSDLPFWLMFSILIFFYQKPKEYFTSDEVKGMDIII